MKVIKCIRKALSNSLLIALSSAVTDVAMAVQSSLARSEEVKDERLNALLKVKAANEAIETAEKAKRVIEALKNTGNLRDAIASSEIKLSATLGKNQSTATSQSQQISQQGSELSASKVVIRATEGDNTLIGSKINATETEVEGNNVNLLASTDSQSQRTNNQNSGWGVGVLAGSTGIGIEGTANVGKGYSNSDTQQQNQTEINSDSLKIKATETTTLKGAVANIDHLQLDTQNLRIESVQDRENDESTEKQGGGKALFSYGGTGSSLSAQGSQNNAKVDYAQVTEQSGFNIGKSSHISVTENTHLKGGVINAEGDQANHQMQTGTLTTENIENRSEIKVSSLSGGISTDMSQLATSAIGAALSGLGNLNESDRSQTQSAISSNINVQITDSNKQKSLTGKTAEETLQSLNRDTVNANQKLEKPDLTKVQERQETAQVIGDLSQSGINRLVGEHLKEANQKRAEAESIAQTAPAKAESLRNEAKVIEAEYGVGSSLQMGIRAATGALQGVATGNSNQAIVGGLSPYANKAIKEATTNADGTVNKEANLIAHAVLGAVEAKATGNNALAGATSALTAEASAPYLMQVIYGKDKAENLSDSQKQNIANLSQVVAGLSGGLAGDSTGSVVAGAEIGKRAVENNALTPGDVYRAVKDLKEALANGKSVDEVYEKYRKLSQEQRAELLSNCGIDCRIPVGMLLNSANEMAGSYSGLLGGWLSGLPISERGRFLDLIETENAITLQELDKRKGGLEKGLELGAEIAQSLRKDEARSNNPPVSSLAKKTKPILQKPTGKIVEEANIKLQDGEISSYRSNRKHIDGRNPRAGVEPDNVLSLFKKSVLSPKDGNNKNIRYSLDDKGNIHRFFGDINTGEYHWSGSTGDRENPLDDKNIPNEIKKQLRGRK